MAALETAAALALGALFLRRSTSAGPQAYKRGQPIAVTLVPVDGSGHLLSQAAAQDFARMRAAAHGVGVQLIIESSFRTNDEQAELYAAYQAGERVDVVAPPGYSDHQSGEAVDLKTNRGTNDAYRWLVSNAHLFNFYSTVPSEPWHWEHRT